MIYRLLIVTFLLLQTVTPSKAQDKSVREFVTTGYIHGIPYTESKVYGHNALPELATMLNDPSMEQHGMNIVSMLGYIGNPEAVKILTSFWSNLGGEVSVDTFRNVLSVPQALGHLAQNDDEALDLLLKLAEGQTQAGVHPSISFKRYKNESLAEVLGRLAIQGLGISGRPEALAYLVEKRGNIRPDWEDNISEAIVLNRRVQNEGVTEVFNNE